MVRPRRAPHRSGAGGPLGGRGRPPRPLVVRAVRSRSWPAGPRGPQPPRIRARSAPPMVSPTACFQSLPRTPRPAIPPLAGAFVRGAHGPPAGGRTPGSEISPWSALGAPLCCAAGWAGGGVRRRGGFELLLTARPAAHARGGRLGCTLVFPIAKLVLGLRVWKFARRPAEEPGAYTRVQLLLAGALSPGPDGNCGQSLYLHTCPPRSEPRP